MLDLQYWSLGCLVDPPLPPQWAPGVAHVHRQCLSRSPGPSIFRSFFRFDFELDFGLVLGPSWARLGLPFGRSNRVKLGPRCILNCSFFENVDFSKIILKPTEKPLFDPQARSKIDPRSLQDRSKTIFKSIFFRLRF